jgi:elongation factor G
MVGQAFLPVTAQVGQTFLSVVALHHETDKNVCLTSCSSERIIFMKAYATESIRNLAVIGHGDAGKTQLISSLLYVAGATPRWGKVDEGTTVTDHEEDSIVRKITLNTALAHLEHRDTKINFIDTPGYAAFISHARPALRVADCALAVVDGVKGVEVQTE